MDYNTHKICRICLEEGAQTSIYSTDFAMMPSSMMMMCAKIKVYKSDGMPAVICNNCIYRLGVAYHFKQECESSDLRLRQYLGISDRGYGYGFCDAATNTDIESKPQCLVKQINNQIDWSDDEDDEEQIQQQQRKGKHRSRYQRKPPEDYKKRGPKPLPKLPQTCFDCNKSFKCAAQLQQHIRTHTGEKPFICLHCPQRFAQKYNLKVHERMHTGEKPFQCEICSKQFSALGNFQAHQKIHTGIRDQLCPVCQKTFYTAGDLSKHISIHTDSKSHHCDICGKAFSRQRDLRAHKRKLHVLEVTTNNENIGVGENDDDEPIDTDPVRVDPLGQDRFKCPDCDKSFDSADNLSLHFRVHASSNLLNLPLSTAPAPPMGMSHTHIPPHYHHHPHESLHTLQPPPPTQMGMMAHMLAGAPPPPPPTPSEQSRYTMLHHTAQRLHY